MQIIQRVKRWTDQEYQFVKDNYSSMSDQEIGEHLGRSASSVKNARLKFDLHRPRITRIQRKNKPKPTFSDVQKMFNERGYILLSKEEEYITQSSKLRYICPKHKDYGVQTISVYHLKEGKGCYYCGRERTNASRKSKVTKDEDMALCKIKDFEYIKTVVENGMPYIYFICNKHRNLGVQKMSRGNMNRECVVGCQYCAGKNLPSWYIKQQIETNYPHIKVLSEYIGMNKPIDCYCENHDVYFSRNAKDVLYHGRGCDQCEHEHRSDAQKLSPDEVVKRVEKYNPDAEIIDMSNYINYDSKIKIRCKKCGYEWFANIYDLRNQNGHCPSCYIRSSSSYGELKIFDILSNLSVNFIPHYPIEECRNIKPLPFDAAIFDNNMNLTGLIEYQGKQHYEPIKYFGGEEKFKERKRNDQIKRDYCEINNIPLLEIPYWDFDNIEDIVSNFIKTI